MKRLTFKQCEKYNKEMWNWLAENPNKKKSNWPGFEKIIKMEEMKDWSYCFACYYCKQNCLKCPIKWFDDPDVFNFNCEDSESIFDDWSYGIDRKKNAKIIANKIWKKGGWNKNV